MRRKKEKVLKKVEKRKDKQKTRDTTRFYTVGKAEKGGKSIEKKLKIGKDQERPTYQSDIKQKGEMNEKSWKEKR